jgi:serine/threonine protein kinase
MPWCLTVVDGADLKRVFPLPFGRVLVGKDPAHSEITFNDFYLEKSHCTLEVAEDGIVVYDTSHERGVSINGKKIVRHASMYPDDVLRVGNTYLRMDVFDGPAPEANEETEEQPTIPVLPLKRMVDLQRHTLGHYELGLAMGRGHHGVTFRARDLEKDRNVALKVLSPDFPDGVNELKKFAQVIKSAAPIANHPHLVQWYGAGKIGPYVWIAQELCESDSLKATFSNPESARYTWRSAWKVAWEVGQALEHLHSKHVAHGNITAANILFTPSGSVKLNDFRFSEALHGSTLHNEVMEQKLLSELPFIPPEKLDKDAFVDEPIADIYSLGVATYTRLSLGKPPLIGNDATETIELILAGVTDKHRRKAPPAPDDFLDIVYKMLARNQEDRYQSMREVMDDLEHFKEAK